MSSFTSEKTSLCALLATEERKWRRKERIASSTSFCGWTSFEEEKAKIEAKYFALSAGQDFIFAPFRLLFFSYSYIRVRMSSRICSRWNWTPSGEFAGHFRILYFFKSSKSIGWSHDERKRKEQKLSYQLLTCLPRVKMSRIWKNTKTERRCTRHCLLPRRVWTILYIRWNS